MQRTVSAQIAFTTAPTTRVVLAVAAARAPGLDFVLEDLSVIASGVEVKPVEIVDTHGGRVHVLDLEAAAVVTVAYRAVIEGRSCEEQPLQGQVHRAGAASPSPARRSPHCSPGLLADEGEDLMARIRYVRPSRYAESDVLLPTAYGEFAGLGGAELVLAVREWVHRSLSYIPGLSRVTDGAVTTLLQRRGVCRDYAHLAIALLRALDVPARLAAVYAPGLNPMDFHAVVEAYVDGAWQVIDPTGLAPRASMLRIATGRDAADTAFLSTVGGRLSLSSLSVSAERTDDAGAEPTGEDPGRLLRLG